MRKGLVIALWIVLAAGCGKPSEWRELSDSDGGFAILMRGQPHYFPQQLDTPAGKLSAYLYSSDRPDAFFAVGYTDYPLALAVGAAPEKVFAAARETWLKRVNATGGTPVPLKLAGKYPGMQFTAVGTYQDRPAILEARMYLVDQRLYQIVALSRRGEVPQGVVNRYFESFRLIPVTYTEKIQIKPPKPKAGK